MLKKSSPLKQPGQMESNLAGSIYVRFKPGIDGPWGQTDKGIPEYPPLCEWGYNYRLIHGLFHIALVISTRHWYWPRGTILSLTWPKGSCEVLPSSVVRPVTFHILIYSSETTGPNGTKLGRKHLYKGTKNCYWLQWDFTMN
jgi:hypothetical protein